MGLSLIHAPVKKIGPVIIGAYKERRRTQQTGGRKEAWSEPCQAGKKWPKKRGGKKALGKWGESA